MDREKLLKIAIKEAEAIFGNKPQEWCIRCVFEKCDMTIDRTFCHTNTLMEMLFHEQDRKRCKAKSLHKFIIATLKDFRKACLLDEYTIVKI